MFEDWRCSCASNSPAVEEMLDRMGPQVKQLYEDERFQKAINTLDFASFAKEFNEFSTKIWQYNAFHRRERRLWSLKIGRGTLSETLERGFIESIAQGRQHYIEAFQAVDKMVPMLIESGFDEVLEQHLARFTATFKDEEHPFFRLVLSYFRHVGCSKPMIDEFRRNFKTIDYDFYGAFPGGLKELRELMAKGVEAQLSILDYTEKHGFSYLRGECGPPEWAVAVEQILASIGASISAWIIVIIIAALLALVIVTCAVAIETDPHGYIAGLCREVQIELGIASF